MDTKTKICYTCKQEKSVDDFHRSRKAKDGRKGNCKECKKGLENGTIKSVYDRHGERKERVCFTGGKFGKLLVGRRTRKINGKGSSVIQYECLCDCGNTTTVSRNNLQSGNVRSCGCLWKEELDARWVKKRIIDQEYRRILYYYKTNARRRNLSWGLSPDDLVNIIKKPCFYCGIPPKSRMLGGREVCCNGIDRVDNTKGV